MDRVYRVCKNLKNLKTAKRREVQSAGAAPRASMFDFKKCCFVQFVENVFYFNQLLLQDNLYLLFFWHRLNMGAYLSQPITEKHSSDVRDSRLKCGASSMQGWRVSQEVSRVFSCLIQLKYLKCKLQLRRLTHLPKTFQFCIVFILTNVTMLG